MTSCSEFPMKKWLLIIFGISFLFMTLCNLETSRALSPYFKADRIIKLQNFQNAKKGLAPEDLDLLELWESMLTGRSAPLSKIMKAEYKSLGLNHLFSPSGFHLSASLLPFFKFIKSSRYQLGILTLIGIILTLLPGFGALKRMVYIKSGQKMFSMGSGFFLGLLIDVLFGSFQSSPLSFIYSFLFLGIIYSGAQGGIMALWFFIAQSMVALFQGYAISPLLLVLSPLLNIFFGLAMPLLFILAIPLWSWQLHTGLWILKFIQILVDYSFVLIQHSPSIEVHLGVLGLMLLFMARKWNYAIVCLLLLSNNLNLDTQKTPAMGSYVFSPQGKVTRIVLKEKEDVIYFSDGKCKRKLIRGFYWENCSPSRRRSNQKRSKKLSYLS
jgi:hypothetical protein